MLVKLPNYLGWMLAREIEGVGPSETDDGKHWPVATISDGRTLLLSYIPFADYEKAEAICDGLAKRVNDALEVTNGR